MMTQFPLSFGWGSNKWLLILANMFAGIILIALSHTGVFPLNDINFLFFSFVGLLFALYRPGWIFLLLIGMLPYEIINIAPETSSLTIRPYQWLLILILISLFLRLLLKRFPVEKFVPNIWDASIVILGLSAFLSAFISDHKTTALKLSIVLFSFILLYFIIRIFVRSLDDIKMLLPFIFSSFLIVVLYSIIQNILFLNGNESFEVMAGRPNATFSEADWFGGYLSVILVLLSTLITFKENSSRVLRYIFSVFLFFGFIALLITVSRSAWLATFFGIITTLFLYARQNGAWKALTDRDYKIFFTMFFLKLFIFVPFFFAFFVVYFSGLSPFDLFDRSKSTATGEQKITVACRKEVVLPQKIVSLEELATYGCEHIRLEEIDSRKFAGEYVTEVFRNDPNVSIRGVIYTKVIQVLKDKPLFGIGFGNISFLLGTDERPARIATSTGKIVDTTESQSIASGGTGLNASNIFLEVWLGTGIIGFVMFLFFWCGLGIKWFFKGIKNNSPLAIVFISLFVTLTIFNLFNSGLFLGFFFSFLALFVIQHSYYE